MGRGLVEECAVTEDVLETTHRVTVAPKSLYQPALHRILDRIRRERATAVPPPPVRANGDLLEPWRPLRQLPTRASSDTHPGESNQA